MNTLHYSALDQLHTDGDNLVFGGHTVQALRELAGRTPFYAYDLSAITARVKTLRQQLPDDVLLHYAIKANPHSKIVNHLASLVDGLDVASSRELALALAAHCAPTAISFAGPGKTFNEIRIAVAAGVVIHIESLTQLRLVQRAARELNKRALIGLRLNPDFELKSSGVKMSGGSSAFGIDVEQLPAVLSELDPLWSQLDGLHIFCGSQNLSATQLIATQQQIFALAQRLLPTLPATLRYLNIGGGFGVPYFAGETALDVAAIGDALRERIMQFRAHAPHTAVVLELGRYLVAEAGIYVIEIVDKKISRGRTFLITNGGLHHHLSAAGLFGQVIRKNFPLVVANKMRQCHREVVNVVGPLCTPLDTLGQQVELATSEIGDLIAVLQSGAYGLTASPRAFLSHPDAIEVIV